MNGGWGMTHSSEKLPGGGQINTQEIPVNERKLNDWQLEESSLGRRPRNCRCHDALLTRLQASRGVETAFQLPSALGCFFTSPSFYFISHKVERWC